MNKTLVFFGGTFDPPHIEHENMVKAVQKELSPDKIIIMPTFIPPHKKTFMSASPSKRLKMCQVAFGDIKGATVSDYEIKQKGKSFSYLTIQKLAQEYKGYTIYFLMGTDMISTFHKWKNPTEILRYATPLLCVRDGENETSNKSKEDFFNRFGVEIKSLNYQGKNLSSTQIKIKKLLRQDISDMVSSPVNRLIDGFSLYNGGERAKFLADNLTPQRLEHTKGVIALAIKYAKQTGVSLKKTVTAAMLHDVAKYLNPADYKDFVMPEGVPNPVVHQYLGAYVCENVLGIKDKEILNAVRYHTSAKPKMSTLAKIIFTADMLEEGRSYSGVEKMREISFQDFEKGFILSLKRSLDYVNEKGGQVYPLTQKAYDYYAKLYQG